MTYSWSTWIYFFKLLCDETPLAVRLKWSDLSWLLARQPGTWAKSCKVKSASLIVLPSLCHLQPPVDRECEALSSSFKLDSDDTGHTRIFQTRSQSYQLCVQKTHQLLKWNQNVIWVLISIYIFVCIFCCPSFLYWRNWLMFHFLFFFFGIWYGIFFI